MPVHRGVLAALLLAVASLLPASAPVGAAPPSCGGRTATVVGTTGDDTLRGTRRADVVVALAGDDSVDGGGGDDLVCGGSGVDRIDGGAGDDRLLGQGDRLDRGPAGTTLTGDVLDGGPGDDVLDGGRDTRRADTRLRPDRYSWASATAGVVVDATGRSGRATGSGTDRLQLQAGGIGLVGSPYDDRITGSPGADRIDGGAGGDEIVAGGGSDQVFPDGLEGAAGDDQVAAGPGADLVASLAGRDGIDTGAGEDYVEATSSLPTRVDAGPDDDQLLQDLVPGRGAESDGGTGDDLVTFLGQRLAGRATEVAVDLRDGTTSAVGVRARGAVAGVERVRLLGGLRWVVRGTGAPERVWAVEGGPLRVTAAGGDDRITGSPRADTLDGGAGSDTADGRGGRDTCRSVEHGGC